MKNIILIVEDIRLRFRIWNSLQEYSFYPIHPIVANNPWEGMRLVQEQYPDFIIADLDILKEEDYEILRQVRQSSFANQIPILLLGDHINRDFYFKAWQLGILLILPKTSSFYLLRQKIYQELNF